MSRPDANLPMKDVEGSSPGGVGSAGTSGSGSKPASPAINPFQDVRGTHDDEISPDEAMPAVEGLAAMAGSDSNSLKLALALAGEDSNGGSKPASPLAAQAHAGDVSGSKPAIPAALQVSAGGASDKGKGKDELAGGEGAGDDVAGDSDGVTGSTSKSTKSSSDGDVQGDVVKDAPTPAVGGSGGKSKGKGKDAVAEGDHALHIWTERERRKKMKNMYSSLHLLLPRLPEKADKTTIVGEAVDYIKTLERTLHNLQNLKLERSRAEQHGAGSSRAAPPPPMRHGVGAPPVRPASRETVLAGMVVSNWNAQQAAAAASPPHEPFQSWTAPNISVSVSGNDGFISVCMPRQPGAVTKALYVLEKYRIDVITMNILSDQNRSIFTINTTLNQATGNVALELTTAEDRYKLAVSELLQWTAN